jgi:hypothetical protein
LHDELQQYPSTQKPDAHSPFIAHGVPLTFGPHELLVHVFVPEHWPIIPAVHEGQHVVASLHKYGSHVSC